ncbi:transforming growth factor, beta receptor associated protein 1 [Podila epicladia]|nr:transforming growth factor, beta receptor associated protein 1 [Podila epicladia]
MATLSSDNLHSERLQQELDYIYQKSGFIYLGETLFDDAFALLQRGKIDPRAVIALFPDVLQKPNILGDITVFVGVLELLKQLQSLPDIIARTMLKSGNDQGDEYKQMFLHNAKEVFQQYLVTFRKHHANLKGPPSPALVAVDTALLGLFAESSDRKQLYTLLESSNSCAKELSEQKLRESDRFYGLSLLYKSTKDYHKTLSIWKRLLTGEIVDDDFSIGLQGMATLLLSIHDAALVTEYGRWIVEQDEEIGLKIFMPGDSKKAAMFDSATLLAGFKKTLSPNGIMAYLEYLVFQRKSDRNASSDEIAKYRTKLVQLLQSSFKYDAAVILPKVVAIPQLQTEKAILLSCTGKQKAAIEVLVKDVRDYLGAEIFCLNAGTFQEAKKTTKVTSETPVDAPTLETRKSLFMMLLQEYLHIPQEHGGTVLSLRLLNSQSAYLELSEVIDLLPPYWTVELLQNYLLRSLRRSHHVFKEIQIMKGLSLGENLRISAELFRLYEEQGPVVVTPQDVCSVCGASIADSVFMRTVDQKTIHLHCGSPAQAQAQAQAHET